MELNEIEKHALALTQEEKAELAEKLLVSLPRQSLLSETWSKAWTQWVEQNVPDPPDSPEAPRTLEHEVHELINQQAILDRDQVFNLLATWFQEVPYLVLSNYDNLEHTSSADPHGRVLMHPMIAVWNGVVTVDQAIARGVWKSFEEFDQMDDRWTEKQN